jgi:hypothetical protein
VPVQVDALVVVQAQTQRRLWYCADRGPVPSGQAVSRAFERVAEVISFRRQVFDARSVRPSRAAVFFGASQAAPEPPPNAARGLRPALRPACYLAAQSRSAANSVAMRVRLASAPVTVSPSTSLFRITDTICSEFVQNLPNQTPKARIINKGQFSVHSSAWTPRGRTRAYCMEAGAQLQRAPLQNVTIR